MALFECPVCHATYRDPSADGTVYFHTCPALSSAELADMPPGQVRQLLPQLPAGFTRAELDQVVLTTPVARTGARDENLDPHFRRPPRGPFDTQPIGDPPRRQNHPARIDRGA